MFTLALAQMRVDGGTNTANVQRAVDRIAEAAPHADVVLLPETLDFGWTHPSARMGAGGIPDGATCAALRDAAWTHQVYVCAGLVERAGNQLFNAAVLIDPRGEVLLQHRKLNELDIAHQLYAQGDRLSVAHTEHGTLGLHICADAFASGQVISRSLCYMGADVILSPCAWAVPPEHDHTVTPYGQEWRDAYGPVAREYAVWIAGCSNVGDITSGAWNGWRCIGCSLVVGPDGADVIQGPYGVDADTILYVDIDPVPRPARGSQWAAGW